MTPHVSGWTDGMLEARATLIAENIPSAASMCYDAGAGQLVIPMNANNAIALIKIP